MIIDFHTHCFADSVAKKAIPLLTARSGFTATTDGTLSGLIQSMDRAGIHRSVVCPIATKESQTAIINDWAISIMSERITPFGTIHPEYRDWERELNRLKNHGIKGLKLHPDYQDFYVDEKRLYPLYEMMQSLDMIALFHAGLDIGLPEPIHCPPDRLAKVLNDFPQLVVVAAHMGGHKLWDEVLDILCGQNVYFDTSFAHYLLDDDGMMRLIKKHGTHRILFGSDLPWDDQKEQVEMINRLALTREEREQILHSNAEELLSTS